MSQILISEKTFEKARKLIRENKENSIIFSSEDDDLNRKILEKENISILLLNQKIEKILQNKEIRDLIQSWQK